jgi:hypothetical protein
MPATLLDSIVLAAMVAISIYLWRNKTLGVLENLGFDGPRGSASRASAGSSSDFGTA